MDLINPDSHPWNSKLREPRLGVMLHYDASANDRSAVAWLLHDPRCRVSYNFLILDSGETVGIAPPDARAWHAGVCKPADPRLVYRDANSAFYGLSLAATDGDRATPAAKRSVADLCRALFARHGWEPSEVWRIVAHSAEAVYPAKLPDGKPHPLAGQRGRKHDPEGSDPLHPVLSLAEIRGMVAAGPPILANP